MSVKLVVHSNQSKKMSEFIHFRLKMYHLRKSISYIYNYDHIYHRDRKLTLRVAYYLILSFTKVSQTWLYFKINSHTLHQGEIIAKIIKIYGEIYGPVFTNGKLGMKHPWVRKIMIFIFQIKSHALLKGEIIANL